MAADVLPIYNLDDMRVKSAREECGNWKDDKNEYAERQ
jgi:hypothetical protein